VIFQLVQIIGKPPDNGVENNLLDVLRQELNQESLVQAIETATLEEAEETLPILLPDMIVMFVDDLATPEEMSKIDFIREFCQGVREQLAEHRSILVISSKSADKEERINYFLSGADDYLPLTTEPEEFAVRLLVHLRRNVEVLSNKQTRLPGSSLFARIIQRHINLEVPWALMMIGLEHFQDYAEVYGRIPCEQIMRTLAAMLKAVIIPPDIVGQTDTEHLLVLSTPDKAEKLATRLCHQFDEVVASFYSERDQKRGYIVSVINEQISRRVPFVSLNVGISSSETAPHKSYHSAFTQAQDMRQLAQGAGYGSRWMSESKRLTGSTISESQRTKKVLIVESDAALAYLLKTTLEMQGYVVEIAINPDEAKSLLESECIDLVLVDPLLHGEPQGLELSAWIRTQDAYKAIRIISISTLHDREKALSAGADVYLPKPFELSSLFNWVDYFLK
jgi:DNA-binding response OmpR family regulator